MEHHPRVSMGFFFLLKSFIYLLIIFIEVQLIYSVVLVSGEQQSDSVFYIYTYSQLKSCVFCSF